MSTTSQRIRKHWAKNGHHSRRGRNVLSGGDNTDWSEGMVMYPTSSLTNMSSDFVGDWRSVDNWQRFDMLRVRARCRQLERGNAMCIAFKRNMLNNILGYKGYYEQIDAVDASGNPDLVANEAIKNMRKDFGQPQYFTTRQKLSRLDADRLFLSRLIFDGEVILRKQWGYPSPYNFSWQFINPDYLDHNLNRIEPNGNLTRMGVELDGTFKFPVAYWFLRKRPNDYFYTYHDIGGDRYYRVAANDIIHCHLITEDDEQTRGWPWVFAAGLILFRLGKYQESALINAAIGASRGVYYEKTLPDGFVGDPSELEDSGEVTLDLPQGSGLELPYGTTAKVVDMKYPDQEFESFNNAMMLTAAMVFGTSYATTTGDLSKANFVSSRVGQTEEREQYKSIQQWMIDKWKKPGADEELYRAMISRQLPLPIGKLKQFNRIEFAGRRWGFVQPVDDMKANEMKMDNLIAAPSDIVAETTQESFEDVLIRCKKDEALMEKYGLKRMSSGPHVVTAPASEVEATTTLK